MGRLRAEHAHPGDLTSSGDYAVDELPFAQFSYVFDNTPAYLQEHLLPLTQLSTDLQNPSSFPEFTWIAADEDHNMEGPIDSPPGIGQFLFSQFTDQQYNVAAGDQFVQQEVSTIENSPTWTDPARRTRSSSRSTRTTTTCHWASATRATTFR